MEAASNFPLGFGEKTVGTMRYYEPLAEFGPRRPPQESLVDKFGGLPWGLDPAAWPRCSACGGVQTHLAQLSHHPERLDLGEPGRVLLLFMCYHDPGGCPSWGAGEGANACLILEACRIGVGLTPPHGEAPTALEAVVVDWAEKDDGIPPERYGDFFDESVLYGRYTVEEICAIPHGTKLGGVPSWEQSSEQGPPPPWRFALQLSEWVDCLGPPPEPEEIGRPVSYEIGGRRWERRPAAPRRPFAEEILSKLRALFPSRPPWKPYVHEPRRTVEETGFFVRDDGWSVQTADFAYGTAYVFLRTDRDPPEAALFWQR